MSATALDEALRLTQASVFYDPAAELHSYTYLGEVQVGFERIPVGASVSTSLAATLGDAETIHNYLVTQLNNQADDLTG